MAMKCDNCNKGIMYGNKVSHAKNRSKRTFKPNLHEKKVVFNGRAIKAKLCTTCIKMFKRAATIQKEFSTTTPVASTPTA